MTFREFIRRIGVLTLIGTLVYTTVFTILIMLQRATELNNGVTPMWSQVFALFIMVTSSVILAGLMYDRRKP